MIKTIILTLILTIIVIGSNINYDCTEIALKEYEDLILNTNVEICIGHRTATTILTKKVRIAGHAWLFLKDSNTIYDPNIAGVLTGEIYTYEVYSRGAYPLFAIREEKKLHDEGYDAYLGMYHYKTKKLTFVLFYIDYREKNTEGWRRKYINRYNNK